MKVPVRLKDDPILESILEIRYEPSIPDDAVLGVVYSQMRSDFDPPQQLPVVNIPADIRRSDPNFRYMPLYTFSRDNFFFRLGPRVLVFSHVAPYAGWNGWAAFISMVIEMIGNTGFITGVNRIGLRYINFFESTHLFTDGNIRITLAEKQISREATTIRTEIPDGDFVKVLKVANQATVTASADKTPRNGSLIDIDCVNVAAMSQGSFLSNYQQTIATAHEKEKELFFSVIEGSILDSRRPEY